MDCIVSVDLSPLHLFLLDVHFFSERGSAGLVKPLHYMTSRDRIPLLGLERKIEVEFYDNSNATFFADTCSYVLKVPTVHTTIEEFQVKLFDASDNYLGDGSV